MSRVEELKILWEKEDSVYHDHLTFCQQIL